MQKKCKPYKNFLFFKVSVFLSSLTVSVRKQTPRFKNDSYSFSLIIFAFAKLRVSLQTTPNLCYRQHCTSAYSLILDFMYAFRLPFTSGGASRLPRGHVSAFAPFGHTHMRTSGYACNPAIFLLSQRNSHLYLYCLSFADNECKSELVYAVTPSSYITCKRVLQHASKDMCRKKGNFNKSTHIPISKNGVPALNS